MNDQAKPTNDEAPPVWEGECMGKVIEWKHHKINDKPCVLVLFGIMTGPIRGRRLEWTGWLTENAIEMTLRALEAGGYVGKSVRTLEGFGSKTVQLKIETDTTADGRRFPAIKWVNKVRTLDKAKGLPTDELANIDAMIAKHKPKAKAGAVDTNDPDDYDSGSQGDIPFE